MEVMDLYKAFVDLPTSETQLSNIVLNTIYKKKTPMQTNVYRQMSLGVIWN